MKTKKFNLQGYSILAITFIAIHDNVSAEAIYLDIPDTLININDEAFQIDLNDDEIFDFEIVKRSFAFTKTTYYSGYVTSHLCALSIRPKNEGNSIAGFTEIWGGSSVSYFTVYFPYAIGEGINISNSLNFEHGGQQILAFRYTTYNGAYFPNGGIWYPEQNDHYIGVYFNDNSACNYYGWIRCDVMNNGKEILIKDMAYENNCETGILAGDTIGDTVTIGITQLTLFTPTIYSSGGAINIIVNKELVGAKCSIVNLESKTIYNGTLPEIINKFNMDVDDGIYFINITKNEYYYSNQLIIFK